MIPLSKIPPTHALNSDVAITTVKTSVNRENINLLLFFEPQQIESLPYTLNQTINNNFSLVNRILASAQDQRAYKCIIKQT